MGKKKKGTEAAAAKTFRVVAVLFKGLDSEALRRISQELEEDLVAHPKRCDNNECRMPALVTTLLAHLKRYMQLRLQ